MRTRTARKAMVSVLALGATLAAGGCASSTSITALRMNPSPEMYTLTKTHAEVNSRLAITHDSNMRMFLREVHYLFLIDRPSRLTPAPKPY